jgi:hypothetical protein
MMALFGTLFGILFFLSMIALGVFAFVFWIWMLIDCVKNPAIESTEKVVWVVVIALTHFIGALIYFFAGRPRRGMPMPG